MTEARIASALEANGIPFTQDLPERVRLYFTLLQEWNAVMDLTAPAEEEELLDRHFTDSLTLLKTDLTRDVCSLIDVGTGAGFPGMVLAMACPEWKVTLLDAQQKRLSFLQTVADKTDTKNVTLLHARAEEGGVLKELREQFDLATARAVAPLNVLCEYLLPFIRVGGVALCWKGPAVRQEWEQGRRAAFLLGGQLLSARECPIDGRDWEHLIVPIRKERPTPSRYPRRPGTPKSSPLGC